MDQNQVALNKLVWLPLTYKEAGDKSVLDLVEEFGLREQFDLGCVTPVSIKDHLEANRSLVDIWLEWAADKRCSGAYFVEEAGTYVVDEIPAKHASRRRYDDPVEACADYIYREVVSLLKTAEELLYCIIDNETLRKLG